MYLKTKKGPQAHNAIKHIYANSLKLTLLIKNKFFKNKKHIRYVIKLNTIDNTMILCQVLMLLHMFKYYIVISTEKVIVTILVKELSKSIIVSKNIIAA